MYTLRLPAQSLIRRHTLTEGKCRDVEIARIGYCYVHGFCAGGEEGDGGGGIGCCGSEIERGFEFVDVE